MVESGDLVAEAERPSKPSCLLRIGISGHRLQSGRDLDLAAIDKALTTLFNDAENWLGQVASPAFAATRPEITLVSALADGPDQMAVEVFTGRPDAPQTNRRLEAVIPFALDAYAATFQRAEDAVRLRDQVARAASVFELADWQPSEGEGNAFATYWRDQRYATVGGIIVRQSDLLLAVWDGMPGAGPGGTADVIAQAVAGHIPVVSIHPATGALGLITKYRFQDDDSGGDNETIGEEAISDDLFLSFDALTKAYSAARLAKILDDVILPPESADANSIDGLSAFFSKEPVRDRSRAMLYQCLFNTPREKKAATQGVRASMGALFAGGIKLPNLSIATNYVQQGLNSPTWKGLSLSCRSVRLFDDFARAWSRADAIATRLGHHYRSTYVAIFCAAALATLAGLLGLPMKLLDVDEIWFVAAEFLILCVGLLIYWAGRRACQHRRWLNARELSEQMRAHWALGLIGLGGRRVVTRDSRWTAWLFNAYAAAIGVPHMTANVDTLKAIARAIQSEIVEYEAQYHKTNERRLEFNHKKLEIIGNVSLVLAILSSVALIVYFLNEHHFSNEFLRLSMVTMSAALPGIGAAATGIRFQGDFERFAKRSQQTHAALMRLDRQLDQFIAGAGADAPRPRFEELRDIVARLEQVLLSDLDDWRFVYEARPDPGVG